MARFRATVQGNRSEASRLGYNNIKSRTNGWGLGVEVNGYINDNGEDAFEVTLTSGSGADSKTKPLGQFTRKDLK
jgi:hypothetical protein